jgi:hypothetical protein
MPNGFYRIFPPHPIEKTVTLDLQSDHYYLAGMTSNSIYLADQKDPFHILRSSLDLSDTQNLDITYSRNLKLQFGRIRVDSPRIYLTDWNTKTILSGKMDSPILADDYPNTTSFVDAAPLSPKSVVIKTLNDSNNGYILAKETDGVPLLKAPGILEKQDEGFFSTDGMITYDNQLLSFIYLYYYRNQYLVIDSNLQLRFRGRTIDTVSWAKLQTSIIPSEHALTISGTPLLVNNHMAVFEKWLIVHSNLIADNESKSLFNDSYVMDVYNLLTHTYAYSFHAPRRQSKKITGIWLQSNRLALIEGQYLSVSTIDTTLFVR